MKSIALRIDVNTLYGAREGVPRLLELLTRLGAQATFLFSLGPDRSGRQRLFSREHLRKAWRLRRYTAGGWRSHLYGTLLPAPELATRCARSLQAVQDAGFEVGLSGWDAASWTRQASQASPAWTRQQFDRASSRFRILFEREPTVHAAPGWQMNRAAFRLEQSFGFAYASDVRGSQPFWPVVDGELIRCVQVPTTLPTLDECLALDGMAVEQLAAHLLDQTRHPAPGGHVFSANAALEGGRLLPVFERLLTAWQAQGYTLVNLRALVDAVDLSTLPYHRIAEDELPGRPGKVAIQGPVFP